MASSTDYQLLTYKDDVDLNAKLAEWEAFYNYQDLTEAWLEKRLMSACLKKCDNSFGQPRLCSSHINLHRKLIALC